MKIVVAALIVKDHQLLVCQRTRHQTMPLNWEFPGGKVEPGDQVSWAVDLIGCETALLRAVLLAAGHQVIYLPGRTVHTMTGAFAGEAKTDPRRRGDREYPGCTGT